MSYDARDLLKKLLKHNPVERLGSGPGDMADIQAHPFFSSLDFDKLMRREVEPQFKPTVRSATDTSNFEAEFTDEAVVDSLVPTSRLTEKKENAFDSFTFKGDRGPMGNA